MSRPMKIIRNIVILAVLLFLLFMRLGFHLTPVAAHEYSERSIHYGPSKVVHIEDFEDGKYILGKYDKWVSCNTVHRELFFLWRYGNQPVGFENDKTKPVDYTWQGSDQYYNLYGIINDDRVGKVEITLKNGEVLTQTDFYEDLFLFTWEVPESRNNRYYIKDIRAYDSKNNILFEEEY